MGLTWPPSMVAAAVQRCGRKCGGAIEDATVRLKPRDASSGGGQRENCAAGRRPRPINRRLAPIAGSTCTLYMLKMMMLMHIASAAAAAAAGKQIRSSNIKRQSSSCNLESGGSNSRRAMERQTRSSSSCCRSSSNRFYQARGRQAATVLLPPSATHAARCSR